MGLFSDPPRKHTIPLAPGIFVDGKPAIAAIKEGGANWALLYLNGKSVLSTGSVFQHPAPKHEVTFTGAWTPPGDSE